MITFTISARRLACAHYMMLALSLGSLTGAACAEDSFYVSIEQAFVSKVPGSVGPVEVSMVQFRRQVCDLIALLGYTVVTDASAPDSLSISLSGAVTGGASVRATIKLLLSSGRSEQLSAAGETSYREGEAIEGAEGEVQQAIAVADVLAAISGAFIRQGEFQRILGAFDRKSDHAIRGALIRGCLQEHRVSDMLNIACAGKLDRIELGRTIASGAVKGGKNSVIDLGRDGRWVSESGTRVSNKGEVAALLSSKGVDLSCLTRNWSFPSSRVRIPGTRATHGQAS